MVRERDGEQWNDTTAALAAAAAAWQQRV